MAGLIDKYMVWQFIKRIATPFEMMPAYKLGLIDRKGRFLVSLNDLVTIEQQQALTEYDVMIINLKRLLAQLPGGSSNLANLAAGLLIFKQWGLRKEESTIDKLFTMESDLKNMLAIVEDAPIVSSGSGAVYGTGSAYAITSAGNAGEVLVSQGSSAPIWSGVYGGAF